MYHGAIIDIRNEWHGVVPVKEEQWPLVVDDLELGRHVSVRVFKVCCPSALCFCGRKAKDGAVTGVA